MSQIQRTNYLTGFNKIYLYLSLFLSLMFKELSVKYIDNHMCQCHIGAYHCTREWLFNWMRHPGRHRGRRHRKQEKNFQMCKLLWVRVSAKCLWYYNTFQPTHRDTISQKVVLFFQLVHSPEEQELLSIVFKKTNNKREISLLMPLNDVSQVTVRSGVR